MPVEIKRVNEREVWVGGNRTRFIDNKIIFVVATGEQTIEMAIEQAEVNEQFSKLADGKIHYLIDLNHCGKNSPEARAKWTQLSEDEKTDKVAIYGLHPVARVIASFVIGVTKRNNQKFFKTKEEALAWLNEEKLL